MDPPPRRPDAVWLALLLTAFALAAYGSTLNLPFIGDDYIFLDKTRDASFVDLWSFKNVDFGWYRPWSRELHFWCLQRVAGFHEVAYRIMGMVLWIATLSLYAAIVRRLASARVAVLARLASESAPVGAAAAPAPPPAAAESTGPPVAIAAPRGAQVT